MDQKAKLSKCFCITKCEEFKLNISRKLLIVLLILIILSQNLIFSLINMKSFFTHIKLFHISVIILDFSVIQMGTFCTWYHPRVSLSKPEPIMSIILPQRSVSGAVQFSSPPHLP